MAVKLLDVSFDGKSLSNDFGIGLLSYKVQSATSRKTRGITFLVEMVRTKSIQRTLQKVLHFRW